MRHWRQIVSCLAVVATGVADAKAPVVARQGVRQADSRILYIGTLGPAIWASRFDSRTGALTLVGPAVAVDHPGWIMVDAPSRRLFAVSETGNEGQAQGKVLSFAIDPATAMLTPISQAPSGGGGATFVSCERRVATAFVSNFGGGQIASPLPKGQGAILGPVEQVRAEWRQGCQ